MERGGQKAAPFTLLNVLSTGLFESECNADSDLEIVAPFVVQRERVPFLERHVVKLEQPHTKVVADLYVNTPTQTPSERRIRIEVLDLPLHSAYQRVGESLHPVSSRGESRTEQESSCAEVDIRSEHFKLFFVITDVRDHAKIL